MTMNAMVCTAPGHLVLERRPIPIRSAADVLIRIKRVGVCGTDMHIYRGTQPFLAYPRVMGHELAGIVVQAPDASELEPGEQVYVMPYMSCGTCAACRKNKPNCCMNIQVLGVHCDGGMAEYLSVPAGFVRRAEGITLDEAAMIEFLAIGAHAVRRAQVEPGQSVLVVGAGPIGIATALFAKLQGGIVTALDGRQDRLDFCGKHLGTDHLIALDADTPGKLAKLTNGDFFDVVFDATGNPQAMEAGFAYVGHGASYVLISVVGSDITFSDPEFHKREASLLGSRNAAPQDFDAVVEAIRAGKVPTKALNTHAAALEGLADALPLWMDPQTGVIKAIVAC